MHYRQMGSDIIFPILACLSVSMILYMQLACSEMSYSNGHNSGSIGCTERYQCILSSSGPELSIELPYCTCNVQERTENEAKISKQQTNTHK